MSSVDNARREAMFLAIDAKALGNSALEIALRARHRALPGTPLPSGFPARAKLVAAGYLATEDLTGADESELQRLAALTRAEARAALAAVG